MRPAALEAIAAYHWPGNVRELRNVMEQAVLIAPNETVQLGDLSLPQAMPLARDTRARLGANGNNELASAELDLIRQALDHTGWNITQAAQMLGVSRDTLRYRVEKHGLKRES